MGKSYLLTSLLSKDKKMKIGIDCRLAGAKHAGIGRYTKSLLLNLINKKSKYKWILFFYDQKQATEVLGKSISNDNIEIIITPIKHYSIEEQLKLPNIFKSANLDLLHVPHFNIPIFYRKKIIITIHDLLWHEYGGKNATTLNPVKYFLKYFFYKIVTKVAVTKASKILVPTKTIKNTVIKFYPKTKNKIIITKEGGKIHNHKLKNIKRHKKTLLYVGSLYPHKNVRLILESLPLLKNYKLLIVGSKNIFKNAIENFAKYKEIEDRVTFLGYVNDEKLTKLYMEATALIQPSFSEGFGLTGVEAMSLGTPILASDIPIFREVYQDVACYFSPHSSPSFINAVHGLEKIDQNKLRKGVNLAKTYDWNKMALKTLKAYKDVIS